MCLLLTDESRRGQKAAPHAEAGRADYEDGIQDRVRAAQGQDLGDDEDVDGEDVSANGVTVI